MKAYSVSHLKEMNREKVFKILCECDITSKTEISHRTGISLPTVNKIVNFFMEKGLVQEIGGGEAALGRKPQMLRLNKERYLSIGVILEGDYLKAGLITLRHETILMKRIAVREDFRAVISTTVCNLINELLVESNCKLSDVLGIGIGIPAIYDVKDRTVDMAPLIGLREKTDISDLIDALEQKYRIPVIVDNDLNMEVQGEFISMGLKSSDDLIYLSVGTGIGSGVILNGKLRRGSHYMCGEVGYMTFLNDYVASSDKGGWLEDKININALCQKYSLENLAELSGKDHDTAVDIVSTYLSLCINNMMMCLDSNHFSVGGEMFNLLGEDLFRAICEKVNHLMIQAPDLHRSSSEEPGVLGAANVVATYAVGQLLEE